MATIETKRQAYATTLDLVRQYASSGAVNDYGAIGLCLKETYHKLIALIEDTERTD
jgi:hypothetical protein